jgi:hypothetical protein
MPPHERVHAFHINETALAAQNINTRLQLDALGRQLNLSMTVNGTINNWFHFFYDSWFDFSRLNILNFHTSRATSSQTRRRWAALPSSCPYKMAFLPIAARRM